jgi:hypothetical protein
MYSDFRDVVKGPDYLGPDYKTLLSVLTAFGQRKGCRFEELRREFGPDTASWKETLEELITRGVKEGHLRDTTRGMTRWIEVV